MSDSLQPHEPQHTRSPCPSLTPGVHPNSCPLSRWCHPAISSSVIPFSSRPQSFPSSGLFKWISPLHQVAKILEFQLQHQSFQWMHKTDLLWDGLVGSPCHPRDSKESSPTPQFKSINSSAFPGRLPSMGSHRVGHDWSDLAATAAHAYHWTTGMGAVYYCIFLVALVVFSLLWSRERGVFLWGPFKWCPL